MYHIPVLLKEVIEILEPKPEKFIIDATVDGGGHLGSILEKMKPKGKILALDWDQEILNRTKNRIERELQISKSKIQIYWVNDNFSNLAQILADKNLPQADGLLIDLGISKEQICLSDRGFSFNPSAADEPLLMTYSDKQKPLYQWLEELPEKQLADIIRNYGEERFAKSIARAIKKNLPIRTSGALVKIINQAVPSFYKHQRLHPATKTFMALRIFVNEEMENLSKILNSLTAIVKKNGRVIIISFHSLEDRLVKNAFKEMTIAGQAILLTKKPLRPTAQEIRINPAARSAKLRAIQLN